MQSNSVRPAWSQNVRAQTPLLQTPPKPTILVVASDGDLQPYMLPAFDYLTARTQPEFAAHLARERPSVAIIDADHSGLDGAAACTTLRAHCDTSILVATTSPEQVPVMLKAGCDAILMKPFAPNLLAGRIGRMLRARSLQLRRPDGTRIVTQSLGTNRVWPAVTCPRCSEPNAVSFDFTSHRRMWFACLACNQVWIGERQE